MSKNDSANIEDYDRQMQRLQDQLMRLDPERVHHESRVPAHITRLLDNISDSQMEKISFLGVEKWRCRYEASDEDFFRLEDQIIDILGGITNELAHAAVKVNRNGNVDTEKTLAETKNSNPIRTHEMKAFLILRTPTSPKLNDSYPRRKPTKAVADNVQEATQTTSQN